MTENNELVPTLNIHYANPGYGTINSRFTGKCVKLPSLPNLSQKLCKPWMTNIAMLVYAYNTG